MAIAEQSYGGDVGEDEGDEERQQSEHGDAGFALSQTIHVNLQRSQKHDVVESYPAKQLE